MRRQRRPGRRLCGPRCSSCTGCRFTIVRAVPARGADPRPNRRCVGLADRSLCTAAGTAISTGTGTGTGTGTATMAGTCTGRFGW
ncbi:hypothetical protein D8W71_13060 [Rhodococcus sp. P1Y]|nr:hypothetical protein D8W71_13060 [Rhodococcus sp. P1Y]